MSRPARLWLLVGFEVLIDVAAVAGCFLLAFHLRRLVLVLGPLKQDLSLYLEVWPVLLIWPLMLWREGLYPGLWYSGGEYLRRIVAGTTAASLGVLALTFFTQTGPEYSRAIVGGGWLISLVGLPLGRYGARRLLALTGLAGPRAVVLGAGGAGKRLARALEERRPQALRPVAAFDDEIEPQEDWIENVPLVGPIDRAPEWAERHGVQVAIIALPKLQNPRLLEIVEESSRHFPRLLILPDLFGLSTADVDARDVGGMLALEIRKNLLYPHSRLTKRATDLLLTVTTAVLTVPIAAVAAAAIHLESGRPILYSHERIGKEGERFTAWKFRTMVHDAEEVLRRHLEDNPALKAEWEARHKLRNDPRLTGVGVALRRLSLDELPQLWNVLRGEMSVVGPRPIVEQEIERYGPMYSLYTQVRPGITGLWQVSGRSDLDYEERVQLDAYYVRNWSVWLDLVIIARTFWAVLSGRGAY